jgi:hypothetical protein
MQISAAAQHHVQGARHAAPTEGGGAEKASAKAPAAPSPPAAVVSISSKAQSAYAAAHAGGDVDHDGDAK